MVKLDPNHTTVRIMLAIIVFYIISSIILNNIVQKDYDYDSVKQRILDAKKSDDLIDPIREINRISNSLLHRTAMTVEQHNAMTAQLRKIIDEVSLEPGKNVVLSGHGGTLSNNIDLLIDVNKVGELDDRDETGFIILSRNGDKVIAEYKYKSIWHFANAFIEFEIN